jgi:hypothetical protein
MNTETYINELRDNFEKALEIMISKNKDYAGKDDPFKNFEMSSIVGVKPERAILVRVTDKISRISNLLDREGNVTDEKITDTIIDCMNYLNILKVYLENKDD